MIKEYEKIQTVYQRDYTTKKLNENVYRDDTIKFLKDVDWEFTEKIDGTNIRVYYNGHWVQYFGRTDKAQIPQHLVNKLIELFGGVANEEMFEQKFGTNEVLLIGEGYGNKIQNGGLYCSDVSFILFDVCVNGKYLSRDNVRDIANYFNIEVVPTILIGKLQEGIDLVKTKPKSTIGNADMEGLVARPIKELYDENGNRVIVKIKCCDFEWGFMAEEEDDITKGTKH